MKEIEIKIKIRDAEDIAKRIRSLGGKFVGDIHQEMFVFFKPDNSNISAGIFPRIRKDNDAITLTVKVKREQSDNYFKRDEYTIPLESVESGTELLGALGYAKMRPLKKTRQVWTLRNAELCIDHTWFGDYLEIEGSEEDIENMIILLKLETEPRITKSYLALEDEAEASDSSLRQLQ